MKPIIKDEGQRDNTRLTKAFLSYMSFLSTRLPKMSTAEAEKEEEFYRGIMLQAVITYFIEFEDYLKYCKHYYGQQLDNLAEKERQHTKIEIEND